MDVERIEASRSIDPDLVSSLATDIDNGSATCAVVGLGLIGTLSLRGVIKAGFRAIGYDREKSAVERFRRSCPYVGQPYDWTVSSDSSVLALADVAIIVVRGKPALDAGYDFEPLISVAADLVRFPNKRGVRLCLIESTVPPGATRRFAADGLSSARTQHLVAHCPERVRVGETEEDIARTPRLVGGLDSHAGVLATSLLRRLGHGPVNVSSPEVSELSKLLENAFLSTGIALVSDVTRVAHGLGIDAAEVTSAAATKPHGYYPFHPGPGIGGHCLKNDLAMLRSTAADIAVKSPTLDGVAESLVEMPSTTIARLANAVGQLGRSLWGAEIALVGVGFKIGSPDVSETPATDIVRLLRARGVSVCYLDHQVPHFVVDDLAVRRLSPADLMDARMTAAVILSGDASLNLDDLGRVAAVVLDAGGARIMTGSHPRQTL
jgi:UDP-N-acetyl-D-glucosamine dehydrogenase